MTDEARGEVRRDGIAVSAGIAIGRAFLVGRDTIKTPRYHVDADDADAEIARLKKAIAASNRQLEKIKAKLATEHESDYHIISASQLMLHDEHLVDAAIGYIQNELINAEWGLKKAVDDIRGVFAQIEDEYIRERQSDVEFVADRVLRNLLGRETGPLQPPPDAIVVAYDLSPADTSQLHRAAVAGLITDAGGKTSHTAIIARAHQIPAVVGLEDITEVVESDDLLIVDGGAGMVIVNPHASTVAEYRDEQRRQAVVGAALMSMRDLPARTRCGVDISLAANLDGPDDAAAAVDHGAVGVGLVRTEYLFMNHDAPGEEVHYETSLAILERMGGRPVTVRTFDLGADKLAPFLIEAQLDEANPALGLRSIRLCLTDLGLPLFKSQLRGLFRAAKHGPIRIMFPMISGVGELRAVLAVVDEVKAGLVADGSVFDPDAKLGVMIEMPSAAITADLIADEVDFFSIGTNDLIQYTIAVDRVNENVSYLYEPFHPAILRLIAGVAKAGRMRGIPVSVCGEMAGDVIVAPILIGLGIHDFSMSAPSIPEVKSVIRSLTVADCERLVEGVLKLPTAAEVRQAVRGYLDEVGWPR
jgi:phosphotransferase system enzyme I (PtsI)